MKRVFGLFEAVFDACYLIAAAIIGIILIVTSGGYGARLLAGVMALVLAGGDAFHLIPRVCVISSGKEERFRSALGRGKQITSITMTVFYVMLWKLVPGIGSEWNWIVYLLAAVRILLCLFPQNRWQDRYPPVSWGVWRNIPFFLLGLTVAVGFYLSPGEVSGLGLMWLAIALSFLFYLPVVLWANKHPKVGMLMLPKTCAYIWILAMCLCL